jgi:uncharacterized protein (DUF983 family)
MARRGRPSTGRVLWWGCTRRCARCGAGGIFRGYFTLLPECPHCGLRFEREEGYFLGGVVINIGFVSALFAVAMVVTLAFMVPEVPAVPLVAVLGTVMVVSPIVFYPFSKTIWMAVDRAVLHRLDPHERLE